MGCPASKPSHEPLHRLVHHRHRKINEQVEHRMVVWADCAWEEMESVSWEAPEPTEKTHAKTKPLGTQNIRQVVEQLSD